MGTESRRDGTRAKRPREDGGSPATTAAPTESIAIHKRRPGSGTLSWTSRPTPMAQLENKSIGTPSHHMASPADLAAFMHDYLAARSPVHPKVEHLRQVFEILLFLSLKNEEANPLACTILYQPKGARAKPFPARKPHVEISKWTSNAFVKPLRFTIENLRKIAHAVDPQAAALGVFPNASGTLMIWGIVDQFPLHMHPGRPTGTCPSPVASTQP